MKQLAEKNKGKNKGETLHDEVVRYLHQARAIVELISSDNAFEHVEPHVVANVLWALIDRIDDVERVINSIDVDAA